MSTTTNLQQLVINYLTQAQYDAAKTAGTLDENQIYMTPDSDQIYIIDWETASTYTYNNLKAAIDDGKIIRSTDGVVYQAEYTSNYICLSYCDVDAEIGEFLNFIPQMNYGIINTSNQVSYYGHEYIARQSEINDVYDYVDQQIAAITDADNTSY